MTMTTLVARAGAYAMPLRPFQAEILERAREHNVVMVGETGIGKTYVAIALLSEQDYGAGRRAFFMAPTRQLVWQITAKIRQSSTLRVNGYCGRAMELWEAGDWQRELALTRVFVCTPEVVRNALERGYVGMRQINLLVFDECHHVSKRHPYAQVIKLYDAGDPAQMPRIFGTTACPTQTCAEHLHAELRRVELETHETVAYAAAAPLLFETYAKEDPATSGTSVDAQKDDDVSPPVPLDTTLEDGAESPDDWLESEFRDSLYDDLLTILQELKVIPVLRLLLRRGTSGAAQDVERLNKSLRQFILSCVSIYERLGVWCLYKFIDLAIERAAINASLLMTIPGSMYGYHEDAIKTIMMARARQSTCGFAARSCLLKVEALVRQHSLVDDGEDAGAESEDETKTDEDSSGEESSVASTSTALRRQGIIFVTTRIECRVLCEYLNAKLGDEVRASQKSEETSPDCESDGDDSLQDDEIINEPDPVFACVLGQASARDSASFNLPRTEDTLSKFEKGTIPYLVSTAVSIEGVDFPQCSLIVVADRIPSARKLIQLRGRARHEDGIVYYLAEEGDLQHRIHFDSLMKEADAINNLDFSNDKQETVLQQPRSEAARILGGYEFFPSESKISIESTGALLDLDSSISCINMFCQSLPPQLFTVDYKNMYSFTTEVVMKRPMFRAKLTLPPELELESVETEAMHSKATAKAVAAFDACRQLLEQGLLDSSLNSVYRKGKSKATLNANNLSYFISRLHT